MSAARRWVGPVLALLGVTVVALWLAALPHRGASVAQVVTAAPAAPLEGAAIPAGQQRYVAGETADLPGGGRMNVAGPLVGVPAGSAAKLGENALIPVAFTVRVTAGSTPVTVRPDEFSVTISGAQTVLGAIFGTVAPGGASTLTQTVVRTAIPTTGSSAPVVVAPGTTSTLVVPLRVIARSGSFVYSPAGSPLSSWVFTAEDD